MSRTKARLARLFLVLTWVNLIAAAVIGAAVVVYGRDWPAGLTALFRDALGF